MLNLKEKYVADLEKNFLPFWKNAIDTEYGGVFTCYTNEGDQKISDIKYIWSQGRFLWLCCNLLKVKDNFSGGLAPSWSKAADQTYQFLNNHAVMPNNHIVYAVERNGEKISNQMDISIFADCFYVIGCNAYALYKKDAKIFEETFDIYRSIKARIEGNKFQSEPYPIPDVFRSHSIPMILLNVAQEMYETAKILQQPVAQELYNDVERNLKEIMMKFVEHDRIVEMLPMYGQDKNTLLARHVNPGHMLECIWFMWHSLKQLHLNEAEYYTEILAELATGALDKGWDEQYGGLLRYVDKDGGRPKGERRHSALESLIVDTWDTKLWWPHSEALYTTLLLFKVTDDPCWWTWYERIERYVFQTFPNEDKEIGEWIQIRDRKGNPSEKVVALPVKDPFHIIRNYLSIIELLGDK